jgi:hypothetical protein
VPDRDRYQIVHEHRASRMIIEDTGLGIPRTDKVVFLQVTSRKRKKKQKEDFYRLICKELEKECGISPFDVVVSFVKNGDEDWSSLEICSRLMHGDLGRRRGGKQGVIEEKRGGGVRAAATPQRR